MSTTKISVVIPVYKNIDLFLRMLRNNWQYIKDTEVIVVDDGGGENLKQILEKEFAGIVVLVNEKNMGFAKTVNKGIFYSHGDYLLLLNSDVKLIDNAYRIAAEEFKEDKNLFALSFIQIEKKGNLVGKNKIYFDKGFYYHQRVDNDSVGENGRAEGGSSLFDSGKLKKLNGFDEIYSPFYWEDIDLSYRAKQKGWKVLFYPSIKVEHHHESTIAKYNKKDEINIIALRNQFLFTWKNLDTPEKIEQHIFYTIYYFLSNLVKFNFYYHKAFFWAVYKKI